MATTEFNQTNPWLEIWVRPRKVLAHQLKTNPYRWVILLAVLNGLVSGFAWVVALWTKYPLREDYKNGFFAFALIVVGAILGLVSLYVGGWLYRLTGKWLGGKGDFTDVKCAVGWSCYPYLVSGIFSILNSLTVNVPLLGLLFGLIAVVLLMWAFIIALKLLGEAHGFSAWRALAAIFIAAVFVFVVVLIIALLIPLLQPLFANNHVSLLML